MTGEIFISYRRSDLAHARRLHELLKAEGVEAWYDAHVGAGEDWRTVTASALQKARIFVLLFSKAASESDDISKELAAATFSKKLVVPVRLEDIEPEGPFLYELASRNWINAFEDRDAKLKDLAKRLAALVREGAGAAAPTAAPGKREQLLRRTHLLRSKKWVLGTGAVVVLAALGVAAFSFLGGESQPVAGRIAFFGVEAQTEDARAREAAAVASNDIQTAFAAMERDMVASADTAATLARDRLDRARELRAAYAVSGRVTTSGDAASLTILVEDTLTRTTLWSDLVTADGGSASALAGRAAGLLNDKLACVISVRASLRTDDMRIVTRLPKACESVRIPASGHLERWRELAELAPDSPWILGNFAFALFNAIPDASAPTAEELTVRAEASLKRGLELDPKSPEVLRAQVAAVRFHGGSLIEVERAFLDALKQAPRGPNLLGGYGAYLVSLGRNQDFIRFGREALALDPLSQPKLMGIGESMAHGGLPAEAAALYDKAHAMYPASLEFQTRVIDGLFKSVGDVDEVLADPPVAASAETRACLADVVRLARQQTQAGRTASSKRAAACGATGALDPRKALEARAFLGDYEDTLMTAAADPGRFYSDRANPARLFMFDPAIAPMRMDERFTRLVTDMGLVDYWRDSGHPPDFCATEKAPVCALIAPK